MGLAGTAQSKLPYSLVFGKSVCFSLGSPSLLERALYWSNPIIILQTTFTAESPNHQHTPCLPQKMLGDYLIFLLTAIWLTPGGRSAVHIYRGADKSLARPGRK